MSEEKEKAQEMKPVEIATIDVSRRFARVVDAAFESLTVLGAERNPYHLLTDMEKTEVMVESAMMIVAQAGGMASAMAPDAETQTRIIDNLCGRLRHHIEACRSNFLEMQKEERERVALYESKLAAERRSREQKAD